MTDFWENNEIEQYYKELTKYLHDSITSDKDVSSVTDPAYVSIQPSVSDDYDDREHRRKITADA
jgi:hypothetical protein